MRKQVFEFSTKEQTNIFSVFTTIGISIGVLLFFDWQNLNLHASTAFFVVSLISFISLVKEIKKANKTFRKIIVDENKVDLYFSNKMKDKIILNMDEFSITEKADSIEFKNSQEEIIGKVYRNRLKVKEEWIVLINLLPTPARLHRDRPE